MNEPCCVTRRSCTNVTLVRQSGLSVAFGVQQVVKRRSNRRLLQSDAILKHDFNGRSRTIATIHDASCQRHVNDYTTVALCVSAFSG